MIHATSQYLGGFTPIIIVSKPNLCFLRNVSLFSLCVLLWALAPPCPYNCNYISHMLFMGPLLDQTLPLLVNPWNCCQNKHHKMPCRPAWPLHCILHAAVLLTSCACHLLIFSCAYVLYPTLVNGNICNANTTVVNTFIIYIDVEM